MWSADVRDSEKNLSSEISPSCPLGAIKLRGIPCLTTTLYSSQYSNALLSLHSLCDFFALKQRFQLCLLSTKSCVQSYQHNRTY